MSQVAKEKEALNSPTTGRGIWWIDLGMFDDPVSLCQTPEAASESRLVGQSRTV